MVQSDFHDGLIEQSRWFNAKKWLFRAINLAIWGKMPIFAAQQNYKTYRLWLYDLRLLSVGCCPTRE
jgi:hypothetical protein